MDAKELGRRVVTLRRQRGLRREDLASVSKLSMATIAKVEQGAYFPRLETLAKLARALGVRAQDLIADGLSLVA